MKAKLAKRKTGFCYADERKLEGNEIVGCRRTQ